MLNTFNSFFYSFSQQLRFVLINQIFIFHFKTALAHIFTVSLANNPFVHYFCGSCYATKLFKNPPEFRLDKNCIEMMCREIFPTEKGQKLTHLSKPVEYSELKSKKFFCFTKNGCCVGTLDEALERLRENVEKFSRLNEK